MRLLAATIALSLTASTAAQTNAPEPNRALPPELAAWPDRASLTAATTAATATRTTLLIGKAAQLRLSPTTAVDFPVHPEKAAATDTHGGLASLTVTRPGTYRVALGSALWIDVLRDGRAVASAAHTHGPPYSGIRKIVDFRLKPGRHLQLSDGKEPDVTVMIAALN